jgi:hypothetical protein
MMTDRQSTITRVSGSPIRASDADRERMADVLRRHHLDGRIDTHEFQERLERCLQAKTLGELSALSVDLPAGDPPDDRSAGSRWWQRRASLGAIGVPVLVALIIASVIAERPLFFPAVPLLFFFLRGWWWLPGWQRRAALDGRDANALR